MNVDTLIDRVLEDEGLIGDLDEADASRLIAWVVERVRTDAARASSEAEASSVTSKLVQQGRQIARLVTTAQDQPGKASTVAAAAGLPWPPPAATEPLGWLLSRLDSRTSS